jgi:hypothetical protein
MTYLGSGDPARNRTDYYPEERRPGDAREYRT